MVGNTNWDKIVIVINFISKNYVLFDQMFINVTKYIVLVWTFMCRQSALKPYTKLTKEIVEFVFVVNMLTYWSDLHNILLRQNMSIFAEIHNPSSSSMLMLLTRNENNHIYIYIYIKKPKRILFSYAFQHVHCRKLWIIYAL